MNWRRRARRRAPRRLRFPARRVRAVLGHQWLSSRWVRQGLVSLLIFLLVILGAGLPMGPSDDFRRIIRDVLVSDFDFARLARQVAPGWELADLYPEFIRARLDPGDGPLPVVGENGLGMLTRPVEGGQVVSWFGWEDMSAGGEEFSPGLRFHAPGDSPVRAASGGVVVSILPQQDIGEYILVIRHGERWSTLYGGLAQVQVDQGATVDQGQVIGLMAPGDHSELYFELQASGKAVDPAPRLGLRGEN